MPFYNQAVDKRTSNQADMSAGAIMSEGEEQRRDLLSLDCISAGGVDLCLHFPMILMHHVIIITRNFGACFSPLGKHNTELRPMSNSFLSHASPSQLSPLSAQVLLSFPLTKHRVTLTANNSHL